MDLIQYTHDKVDELKASGGAAGVVAFFAQFIPKINIQQINAWRKNGGYPAPVLNGVFASDFREAPEETREIEEVERPPLRAAAQPPTEPFEPELGEEIAADGSDIPPVMPSGYDQRDTLERPNRLHRAADVHVATGRPSGPSGPVQRHPNPTISASNPAFIAAVAQVLFQLGYGEIPTNVPTEPGGRIKPVRGETAPTDPRLRPRDRRPAPMPKTIVRTVQRNWNEPRNNASAAVPPAG